jgi:hypothetical protein
VPAGVRPCLALALAAACVAGITYTLPESESANTRDSVTCTFVIFYDTPTNQSIISKMAAANVGPPHLPLQCQHGLSIIFARRGRLFRLLAKEPIAPLIDVPSSVDTRSVRSVHRQVAQRHILEERSHCWRTNLCRTRRVRGYDTRP